MGREEVRYVRSYMNRCILPFLVNTGLAGWVHEKDIYYRVFTCMGSVKWRMIRQAYVCGVGRCDLLAHTRFM